MIFLKSDIDKLLDNNKQLNHLKTQLLDHAEAEADIHYDSQADNLGRSLKISERITHQRRLRNAFYRFKLFCSDGA